MSELFRQDEQRVVAWVAFYYDENGPCEIRVADVEDKCSRYWEGVGVYRAAETWVRAFRRAKNNGLLGAVKERRQPGTRWYWYAFSKSPEELLAGIGPEFRGIVHGKRTSTAARAA